jgi:hypothetical protein
MNASRRRSVTFVTLEIGLKTILVLSDIREVEKHFSAFPLLRGPATNQQGFSQRGAGMRTVKTVQICKKKPPPLTNRQLNRWGQTGMKAMQIKHTAHACPLGGADALKVLQAGSVPGADNSH